VDDFFLIAEVKAVFNSNGFLLIESFSDFPERFFNLSCVYLEIFNSRKKFFVENVIETDGKIAVKFKGFDNAEDVRFLLGKKIYVDEEHSVKLSNDTFFIHDLIGSTVFRGDELFGLLKDVITMPANDVYIIKDLNNREVLVPAVKSFIKSFDPVKKILELTSDCDLLYNDED
jgi:16S rRNA processing protein RimM